MKNFKWMIPLSVAVLVAACCPCRKGKSLNRSIEGVEWQLKTMNAVSIESDNYRITFADDGKVFGVGDCNRFSGSFTLTDGVLDIADNMAATKMMCPNQQREDRFFQMLAKADAYYIDGSNLMLLHNGEVIAVFEAVAPAK